MKERLLLMLTLFCLLLATSCTEVELCDEPDHPHRTGVKFNFDWTNARNSKVTHEEPDSMFIIAKRIIGTWKCEVEVSSQNGEGWYVWNAPKRKAPEPTIPEEDQDENDDEDVWEPDGMENVENPDVAAVNRREAFVDGDDDDENGSNENDPESPSTPQDPSTPETSTPPSTSTGEPLPGVDIPTSEFQIIPGTYKFVAFNRDTTELIYDEIDQYVQTNQTDATLQDLNLEYKRYAYQDEGLKGTVDYWRDYNNYGNYRNYIQPDITPIYYDTISPVDIRKDVLEQFVFKPILLTQNIDIRFHIRKKVDVIPFTIDSIYADISGIPYKVNLSNNYIAIDSTCKMMFQAHLEDEHGTRVKDTDENTYLLCRGNIDVLSIVNAPDSIVGRGPGIMQVMVFIRDRQPIRGKINLYHPIYRANLYELTEDGQHARRRKEYGVLEIDSNLVIDENFLITSDEDGLERWQSTDDDDIIIDV